MCHADTCFHLSMSSMQGQHPCFCLEVYCIHTINIGHKNQLRALQHLGMTTHLREGILFEYAWWCVWLGGEYID